MKKLLVFVVLFGVLGFGFLAQAQTTGNTLTTTETTQTVKGDTEGKGIWGDKYDKSPWGNFDKGKFGYMHGFKTTEGSLGTLWIIGWLFSIGYLGLTFWKGVLALIIWPYYIGVKFRGGFADKTSEVTK